VDDTLIVMKQPSVRLILAIAIIWFLPVIVFAGQPAPANFAAPPEKIEGAQKFIYKRINSRELSIFVFKPPVQEDHQGKYGAAVFFNGSGWLAGSVRQFETQARLLSQHGLVTALVEYRVKDGYNATPFDGISDAKSALRWLRVNASHSGIDPHKIAAIGASAGGQLALSAAMFQDKFDSKSDDTSVSAIPDVLVLFSTVVDISPAGYNDENGLQLFSGREATVSPVLHISYGLPPVLLLHGTADRWIPLASVMRFAALMREYGNDCELILFQGRSHHFYNSPAYLQARPHLKSNTSDMDFVMSFYLMERFLYEHGILLRRPAIMQPNNLQDQVSSD
jgi:acetyl esterase